MKDYRPHDFDFNKTLGEISAGIKKPNILICGAAGRPPASLCWNAGSGIKKNKFRIGT